MAFDEAYVKWVAASLRGVFQAGLSKRQSATAISQFWLAARCGPSRTALGAGGAAGEGATHSLIERCERALERLSAAAGAPAKLQVQSAKAVLRRGGARGARLASRLGKLSSGRNMEAHPDEAFEADLEAFISSGLAADSTGDEGHSATDFGSGCMPHVVAHRFSELDAGNGDVGRGGATTAASSSDSKHGPCVDVDAIITDIFDGFKFEDNDESSVDRGAITEAVPEAVYGHDCLDKAAHLDAEFVTDTRVDAGTTGDFTKSMDGSADYVDPELLERDQEFMMKRDADGVFAVAPSVLCPVRRRGPATSAGPGHSGRDVRRLGLPYIEGDKVLLMGLQRGDMNGMAGTVIAAASAPAGRVPVELDASGMHVAVKPENLTDPDESEDESLGSSTAGAPRGLSRLVLAGGVVLRVDLSHIPYDVFAQTFAAGDCEDGGGG